MIIIADKEKSDLGYGPNNPEPQEFKASSRPDDASEDALEASLEYIDGKEQASSDKPHMPCKNSLPT